MNYGLYLSASGVLTQMYRQDVFANNLANVQTAGFKPDLATVRQRDAASIEGGFPAVLRQQMLDRLGGGVLAGRQSISFAPGTMQSTGNPLDVALQGENAFFVVGSSDPASGEQVTRLTRDGRFTRNPQGQLVTAAGGHPVLDLGGQPITISDTDAAPVQIESDGRVYQNGGQVGQIQVAGVRDLGGLTKEGQNLFRPPPGADAVSPLENPVVKAGNIESSGVDPIHELMNLINATKEITNNGNLISYHDRLMDRAVNTLGRVA